MAFIARTLRFVCSAETLICVSKRCVLRVQLRVAALSRDDGTIRSSYRLLGTLSLLQLLATVCLQFNSFRQKQRARQEWKLYRSLRCTGVFISRPHLTSQLG